MNKIISESAQRSLEKEYNKGTYWVFYDEDKKLRIIASSKN